MPSINLGREPTLIIYLVLLALNTVQTEVISMPAWLHSTIVVVTTVLAALINRSQVTPALKPVAPVEGRRPMGGS